MTCHPSECLGCCHLHSTPSTSSSEACSFFLGLNNSANLLFFKPESKKTNLFNKNMLQCLSQVYILYPIIQKMHELTCLEWSVWTWLAYPSSALSSLVGSQADWPPAVWPPPPELCGWRALPGETGQWLCHLNPGYVIHKIKNLINYYHWLHGESSDFF